MFKYFPRENMGPIQSYRKGETWHEHRIFHWGHHQTSEQKQLRKFLSRPERKLTHQCFLSGSSNSSEDEHQQFAPFCHAPCRCLLVPWKQYHPIMAKKSYATKSFSNTTRSVPGATVCNSVQEHRVPDNTLGYLALRHAPSMLRLVGRSGPEIPTRTSGHARLEMLLHKFLGYKVLSKADLKLFATRLESGSYSIDRLVLVGRSKRGLLSISVLVQSLIKI